jgi:hypothetical protein
LGLKWSNSELWNPVVLRDFFDEGLWDLTRIISSVGKGILLESSRCKADAEDLGCETIRHTNESWMVKIGPYVAIERDFPRLVLLIVIFFFFRVNLMVNMERNCNYIFEVFEAFHDRQLMSSH